MYTVETGIGTINPKNIDALIEWIRITDICFDSFEISITKTKE
jgi:hypothetical protein